MLTHRTRTTLLNIWSLLATFYHAHAFLNPKCPIMSRFQLMTSSMLQPSSKINAPCNYPYSSRSCYIPSITRKSATPSLIEEISEEEDGHRHFYGASAWSFGSLSALLFLMPDRTLSKQLAFKLGGASGFGLAAFVFYVLSKSSQYEDQGNEFVNFQKRCQLALVGFCGLGLLSFPGEASFWPTAFPAIVTSVLMTVLKMGGLVVALRGWIRSCSDLRWHKELRYGFLDNYRGWKVQDKKKSLFYRNGVFVIFFAMFSNFMEAIFQYRYREALELSSFGGSLHVSAVSRLFLVSSLLFSLKLAAESNNSFPSNFEWQINWALAAWAGLVGIGQCVKFYPLFQISSNRIEMLTLSGLLFIKGLKIFRREATTSSGNGIHSDADSPNSDETSEDELGTKNA